MTNNKKSSVEWFAKEINELNFWLESRQITNREFNRLKLKVLNKAKEKHKEEIIDSYCDGRLSVISKKVISAGQYYNETFGGNNEQQ